MMKLHLGKQLFQYFANKQNISEIELYAKFLEHLLDSRLDFRVLSSSAAEANDIAGKVGLKKTIAFFYLAVFFIFPTALQH
jgi:hypothetical protein